MTEASAPPAIMTSASPYWMVRRASPNEWVEVAQALMTVKQGPAKLYSMATMPLAMLLIMAGMKKGETLRGPFSMRLRDWASKVDMPPMPEPMITPARSRSTLEWSSPESCMASFAAATANWV